MLPPHYHPRAANWVVDILGTTTTYMFEENGAHIVKTVLDSGEATIFPQGSIHCKLLRLRHPWDFADGINSRRQVWSTMVSVALGNPTNTKETRLASSLISC